jgi:nicotinamidase-related amidase
MHENPLILDLQRQKLVQVDGYNIWKKKKEETLWEASKTALLLCDVWDNHWCRGAVERLDAMIDRMEKVVRVCRSEGVLIVHAPSSTMDFYVDSPARKRVFTAPGLDSIDELEHGDPPLPIDASDHGSDTGETDPHGAWHRQHSGIEIDEERDIISDEGKEIYPYLKHHDINHLLIMGVHTNMCVLHRSFGIKQMVRWGMDVALIEDLTDTMYNPASAPYVSHEEGTQLVIDFIEKFWCSTIHSSDLFL